MWVLVKVVGAFTSTVDGRWEVEADINGYTAASIDITRSGGVTSSSTFSLIGGGLHAETTEGALPLNFENYAQLQAFRAGGPNTLTMRVTGDTSDGVLRLRRPTGLEVSPVGPDEIRLGLPRTVVMAPGDVVHIPYELARRGARPDQQVTVTLSAMPEGLEFASARSHSYERVGTTQRGMFAVRATSKGLYTVAVRADSHYNPAGGVLTIRVLAAHRRHLRWPVIGALALLLLVAVGAAARRAQLRWA
jgi:hypothetical protein